MKHKPTQILCRETVERRGHFIPLTETLVLTTRYSLNCFKKTSIAFSLAIVNQRLGWGWVLVLKKVRLKVTMNALGMPFGYAIVTRKNNTPFWFNIVATQKLLYLIWWLISAFLKQSAHYFCFKTQKSLDFTVFRMGPNPKWNITIVSTPLLQHFF